MRVLLPTVRCSVPKDQHKANPERAAAIFSDADLIAVAQHIGCQLGNSVLQHERACAAKDQVEAFMEYIQEYFMDGFVIEMAKRAEVKAAARALRTAMNPPKPPEQATHAAAGSGGRSGRFAAHAQPNYTTSVDEAPARTPSQVCEGLSNILCAVLQPGRCRCEFLLVWTTPRSRLSSHQGTRNSTFGCGGFLIRGLSRGLLEVVEVHGRYTGGTGLAARVTVSVHGMRSSP